MPSLLASPRRRRIRQHARDDHQPYGRDALSFLAFLMTVSHFARPKPSAAPRRRSPSFSTMTMPAGEPAASYRAMPCARLDGCADEYYFSNRRLRAIPRHAKCFGSATGFRRHSGRRTGTSRAAGLRCRARRRCLLGRATTPPAVHIRQCYQPGREPMPRLTELGRR